MNSYSPLCQDVIAQAHSAFAAICDYLGSHPLRAFIRMVQIENEIGSLGTSRDHSSAAEKVYQMALPQEIRNLYPELNNGQKYPLGMKCLWHIIMPQKSKTMQRLQENV